MAIAKKMNIASYRVLSTLLCLFHNNLTMMELIAKLNQADYGPYNNFIVTKYIHTLKSCGIDIQKIQNKYCIVNFPIGMRFSSGEAKLLYDIKLKSERISLDNMSYTVARFFEKIHLSFFKSGMGLLSSPNFNIIKNIEYAHKTNTEVILTYEDEIKEECFIRDIKVQNGKYSFVAVNKKGAKTVDPDNIYNVEFLNKKSKINYSNHSVIFELSGRLAERYQLRENENIIRYKDNGSIVVSNEYEDRHVLIHRLLRYDSMCKVIGPTDFLNEFKAVVRTSLENYNIDPERHSKKYIAKEIKKQQLKQKEKEKKQKKVKKEE